VRILTAVKNKFSSLFPSSETLKNDYGSKAFYEKYFGSKNSISKTRAMQITTVFGCDRILMETASSVSLHLYHVVEDGKLKAKDKELYNLLNLQPNPLMTSSTWRKMMIHDINMRGTHFAQILRNRRGEVIAIYPLIHDSMTVEQRENGEPVYIYQTKKHGRVIFPKEKILSIFTIPDDNGLTGISPIARVMREFVYADTLQEFGQNFFNNGANPTGIFRKDGVLEEKAFYRLKNDLAENYRGLKNSGKPMLLEDGLDFTRLTIANNESQFLESKKFSKEQIASIFRVPTHLLNGYDGATFSNIEQLSQEFIQFTMLPWFTTIEQELMVGLIPKKEQPNFKILFNVDSLLRGDYQSRTEGHATLWRIGALNQNEIRAKEGRNKIENGEKYYVEMNMTPIETKLKEDECQK